MSQLIADLSIKIAEDINRVMARTLDLAPEHTGVIMLLTAGAMIKGMATRLAEVDKTKKRDPFLMAALLAARVAQHGFAVGRKLAADDYRRVTGES